MTESIGYLDALIAHVEAVRWDELPSSVQTAAVTFTADTIAVGLSACQLQDVQRQRRLAQSWGPGTIEPLGTHAQLSAPQAAYLNAFQFHCQEYDPVHEAAVVHAMSVVTAACLADGGRNTFSGRAYLQAIVAGVDAAVGLGIASRAPLSFFRPATAGLMGAVLALCKLHDADQATCKNALGLAYSQLSGTMQAHIEGSPALAYQVGFAARSAIFAWDMAAAGSEGPQDVIEGPFGYMRLIEGQWDLQPSLDRLGKQWAVAELSHKPYPTGRAAHAALRMLDEILQSEASPLEQQQIESITVAVPPLIKRLIDRPYAQGPSLSQARLCLPYLIATRVLRSPITLTAYDQDWLESHDWHGLADKVTVALDGNNDPNALGPQSLTLRTVDGRSLSRQATHTFGSPDMPLTAEQQFEKFSGCLDYGNIVHGTGRQAQWAALQALAEAENVFDVVQSFKTTN